MAFFPVDYREKNAVLFFEFVLVFSYENSLALVRSAIIIVDENSLAWLWIANWN